MSNAIKYLNVTFLNNNTNWFELDWPFTIRQMVQWLEVVLNSTGESIIMQESTNLKEVELAVCAKNIWYYSNGVTRYSKYYKYLPN